MDLIAQLKRSALHSAGEAASAIANGWEVTEFKPASVAELQRTYIIRLAHLRSLTGDHAAQLARSVEELIQRLANVTSVEGGFIRGNAEHHFAVFVDPTVPAVIGVMRVVSKLEVSPDRWEQLWGTH